MVQPSGTLKGGQGKERGSSPKKVGQPTVSEKPPTSQRSPEMAIGSNPAQKSDSPESLKLTPQRRQVLRFINETEIVTPNKVKKRFKYTKAGARSMLSRLVDAGLVEKLCGYGEYGLTEAGIRSLGDG